MNRLRIGPRLITSYAIIILLTISASVLALWQISTLQQQIFTLAVMDERTNAVLYIHNNLLRLPNELEPLAEARDEEQFVSVVDEFNENFAIEIDRTIALLENSPEQQEYQDRIDTLEQLKSDIPPLLNRMAQDAAANNWTAVDEAIHTELHSTFAEVNTLIGNISTAVDTERTQLLTRIDQTRQVILLNLAVTIISSVILASLLAFFVTRSIARPLKQLSRVAQNWGRGNFDHQVKIQGQDELAELAAAFNDGAQRLNRLYNDSEELARQRTAELHRYALQLETSVDIAQRVASILDLDALLQEVAGVICARYGYYYVGVFLVDESGKYATVHANAGRFLNDDLSLTVRIGQEGVIGWVAKHCQPALLHDTHTDKRYMFWDAVPDTRSELALPLKVGDKLLGVLDIQHDEVGTFEQEDIPIFQLLADQIAIAIQNASLYQGELSQRLLAEKLQQTGRALTSSLELGEVLNAILENLSPIVSYDRASVLLSNGEELEFMAARGYSDNQERLGSRVPIYSEDEDNVFVKIYHTQEPLVIDNVHTYASWKKVKGLVSPGSWLGIPLIRDNEVTGLLSLARMEVRPYTEEDVTLAKAFGAQAVIALSNARLYERIKRFSQQMEYEVQNRTKALQDAYDQLEQLDRTKSSFISIASHELRTPITVLKGYSQILQKDPELRRNEYYLKMLTGIQSGAERLHSIVDSMLDMAKIDGRTLEVHPEPLEVYEIITDLFNDLEQEIQERRLSYTITPGLRNLPPFEADYAGIQKVLYHLVVNAIKYTPDGGKVTINGRSWDGNPSNPDWPSKGIEIMVTDTGIGIDPQYQDLIFNKFYQTGEVALHSTGRTKFKGGGPGLGLAITQGIVTAHRGRLWVESEGYDEDNLPGSTFHVVLPLHQHTQQAPTPAEQELTSVN